MKKLLFILLVVLFSCEKEEVRFCWECTTTMEDFQSSVVTCQMSVEEMKEFHNALMLQTLSLTGELPVIICNKHQCY